MATPMGVILIPCLGVSAPGAVPTLERVEEKRYSDPPGIQRSAWDTATRRGYGRPPGIQRSA
ncbi:hypothetical protein Sm713_08800 [Streptomyces sp. TS71-3]|nr:hypothetical protein Sm713_08800 [Streptomyces sp. TS71-3]